MADVFTNVDQPQDLFGGLQNPAEVSVATPKAYQDKTARLAGLALADSGPDLIEQIRANTAMAQETIKTVGDANLRAQAAGRQQVREMEGYASLITDQAVQQYDPQLAVGAALAAEMASQKDIETRRQYALEAEAVDRIQDLAAAGDTSQARMLLNNLQYGDANQVIRDMNTKQLILEREIQKATAGAEEAGWLAKATSFVLSALPLYSSTARIGNVEVDESLKGFGDWFWNGKRTGNESATLWSMPVENFSKFVQEELIPKVAERSMFLGFQDKSKELETLSRLNRPKGVITENAWATLDNLGWVGPAELGKGASITSMLVKNGARKEAKEVIAQAAMDIMSQGTDAAASKSGLQATDVIDNMLPAAVNPEAVTLPVYSQKFMKYTNPLTGKVEEGWVDQELVGMVGPAVKSPPVASVGPTEGVSSVVSLSGETNNMITKATAIIDEYSQLNQLGRLTDEEQAAAIQATIDKVTKEVGEEAVMDVNPVRVGLTDGTYINRVEFTLGSFATEGKAKKYLSEIASGGDVIRDESGRWSVRVNKDVSETGFYTDVLKPTATGFLSRVALNARLIGDRLLANQAQAAGNTRAKLLNTLQHQYADRLRGLPQDQKVALSQILAAGENTSQWFTRDQRDALMERGYNRSMSTKEHEAYETAQEINDLEFDLRNDELYKTKVTQGYESISVDVPGVKVDRVNGRVSTAWNAGSADRIYNITDQVGYSKKTPLSGEEATRLKEEGYVLTHLDKELELPDGTTTRTLLSKRSDITVETLRRDQLGYRAGGHRIYEGKYFAKQAQIGVQPDGEKFFKNPNVYIVGQTKAEVDKWTAQMEKARTLFNENRFDEIDEALPAYMSGEEFIADMKSGVLDKDQVFRTMYDREVMPEYTGRNDFGDMRDVEESDVQGYLRTNGRMYYGGKGKALKDYQGSSAPTLDPFKTINTSLMNVANLSSFSDYKLSASERWMNTFGDYLTDPNLNAVSALRSGVFKEDIPDAIRQGAEAQREIIKRTLGWRTEFDRQQEIYSRRMTEWIGGDDPNSLRSSATSSITKWWDDKNPVQALRGIAFDLKLGLFNVAQFPLQLGTLVAATTMSPKYGFQGMVNLAPMLYGFMTKSGTEHMLDTLIDRGLHKTLGMEADEYKVFMKSAKQSGFFDIGGTHQLISDYGPSASAGAFSSVGRVREAGRFWFYEGERWNRAVAWRIAWGETRDKFPNLAIKSNDFQRELAGRAEEYSFSMSEQSSAAWQKGITSIPTQFWAYSARVMEAMIGKTFTPQQKARLILGQTLLYGSAGIPVAPYISELVKGKAGESPQIGSPLSFLDRGVVDNAVFYLTGSDLLVSRRFGTGAFTTDTIKDLFGKSTYGETSFMDVALGATGSITMDGFETIQDILKYGAAESGGDIGRPLTNEAFMRLAKNISTVSNAHKAYLVSKYGTLVSNKGTVMATDVPSESAWGVALGLAPGATDQVSSKMAYLKNNKEAVDEATKVIGNYRTQMATQPDRREEIYEEINAYVRLLPDNVRIQALKKTQGRMNNSLLEGLEMQVAKDKARIETLQQMENEVGPDGNP